MEAPSGSRSAFGHWGTSLLLVIATVTVLGQTAPGQPSMLIASPVEGSLISGKVVLHADLDPPAAASSVVFFVDGRQVCTVTVPPYEWPATSEPPSSHQVRVVATIPGGARIVQRPHEGTGITGRSRCRGRWSSR